MSDTEPIRLNNLVIALVLILINGAIKYLSDIDVKTAIVLMLTELSALLASAEINRRMVASPATFKAATGRDIGEL